MTPLERLRDMGMTVRYKEEEDRLMCGPTDIAKKWSDFIAEHRQEIIAELDCEKKEAALAKLPFPEFEAGPVEMREVYLLKVFDGEYLAVTKKEFGSLGGSGLARAAEERLHGESAPAETQPRSAGVDCC